MTYTLHQKKVYTLFPGEYSKCRLSRVYNWLEGQPIMLWVIHDLGVEYLLTETQRVYFLLELSVLKYLACIPVCPCCIRGIKFKDCFWYSVAFTDDFHTFSAKVSVG